MRSFLDETDDEDLILIGSRFAALTAEDDPRMHRRPHRDPERRHDKSSGQQKKRVRQKLH